LSASAHGAVRTSLLTRLADRWRLWSVGNALAFEDGGGTLSEMSVRLGADDHRPAWARQYLRLWRAAYLRYGIALPVRGVLRRGAAR